jgi:adenylate cyclase
MRISISIKLILLVVSFLVATTAFFAQKSSSDFASVLSFREERENSQMALLKLKEIEGLVLSYQQRLDVLGTLLVRKSPALTPQQVPDEFWIAFGNEKNFINVEVYDISKTQLHLLGRRTKLGELQQAQLPPNYIESMRNKLPFPIRSLSQKPIEIQNSSFNKQLPLLTIGAPLFRDDNNNITHVVIGDILLGSIQKPFSERSERTLFMTDKLGYVLAHKDEKKALDRFQFTDSPILQRSIQEGAGPNLQIQYFDPYEQTEMFGAYAKGNLGITVFSQIEKEKILEPAVQIKKDAVKLAGQMIAVAFFLSFLFSLSLTSPIESLAAMIQVVSRGNFDVKARSRVRSNDEVGDLAIAFDKMTEGLKERDKVKNLFSKFHGSSVAEEMLKKDMSVGGTNKEVSIFFSDIRGFTSFSENRSPEEVVEMLNEYFSVMVGIINKNKGVVDKFIGDAIMAVWGAPHSSDRDTHNAVRACLEMRKALGELNAKRGERQQPPLFIGMGLHHGRAISGTIGSQERMEYTVIGDTVNMTSRIESSTKAFGTDLLVSEAVYAKVQEEFKMELAGEAEVKGKTEPIKMYKVLAMKNASGEWEEIKTAYSEYEKEKADKVKVAA